VAVASWTDEQILANGKEEALKMVGGLTAAEGRDVITTFWQNPHQDTGKEFTGNIYQNAYYPGSDKAHTSMIWRAPRVSSGNSNGNGRPRRAYGRNPIVDAIHQGQNEFAANPFGGLVLSLPTFVVGGALAAIGNLGKLVNVAKGGASLWPAASSGKAIINGIEYTKHALERMQPVGTIIRGTEMFSRGIPPSAVHHAIKYGKVTAGNSVTEIVRTFENVRVITNPTGTKVFSVIKLGH